MREPFPYGKKKYDDHKALASKKSPLREKGEKKEEGAKKDAPKDVKNDKGDMLSKALFDARFIFLAGEINDKKAQEICKQLIGLAMTNSDPITLVVSSPGGHVESGDMIHDMIRFIRPKARVRMLGTGWVASAGALIFVSVPKEDRFCLANTRFLLHEPRGGVGGSASDIDIQAKEILRMRKRLNNIFVNATQQSLERIEADTYRDYWMDAKEAKEYGVVTHIIQTIDDLV